jgi:hypothetical protein
MRVNKLPGGASKICSPGVQTRDNIEQLRFVAPPAVLLAKDEPNCHAGATSAPPGMSSIDAPSASIVRGQSISAQAVAEATSERMTAAAGHRPVPAALLGVGAVPAPEPETWLPQRFYSSPPGHTCVPPPLACPDLPHCWTCFPDVAATKQKHV